MPKRDFRQSGQPHREEVPDSRYDVREVGLSSCQTTWPLTAAIKADCLEVKAVRAGASLSCFEMLSVLGAATVIGWRVTLSSREQRQILIADKDHKYDV